MKHTLAGWMVLSAALLLLAPATASAQRGGRAGMGGGGRISAGPRVFNPVPPRLGLGFGNVVSPSGIRPSSGITNPIFSPNNNFPNRLGATISGNTGFFTSNRRSGLVYPVIVGGYGYGFGGYGYPQPAPQVTIINAPPPAPIVIVNESYSPPRAANPIVREVTSDASGRVTNNGVRVIRVPAPSNPEGDPIDSVEEEAAPGEQNGAARRLPGEPTVYLLAMADGAVYSAYAYWMEGEMLHYITTKYAHNQASADQLDMPVTTQINRERGIEFELR